MSTLIFPTTTNVPGQDIKYRRESIDDIRVQTTLGQQEVRFTWALCPRYIWTFDYNLLRYTAAKLEFQRLVGFYARHRGSLDSFLLSDLEDFAVVDPHYFGVGDGVTTDFQLQRTLTPDADLNAALTRSYWPRFSDGYEPVFELNGAPTIKKNGVTQTNPTNYTLPGNGVVHFTVAPAANALLSWAGSFFYRARFYTDKLASDRMFQSMWEARQVQLISVLP